MYVLVLFQIEAGDGVSAAMDQLQQDNVGGLQSCTLSSSSSRLCLSTTGCSPPSVSPMCVCVCVCVCDTLFMGMAASVMYMML